MNLVVIVPTCNEAGNVGPMIEAVRERFCGIPHHCRPLVVEIPVAFEERMHGNSKPGVSDIMEFGAWCLSARFRGEGRRSD